MKNEAKVTIEQLAKIYKPEIWDTVDQISNLSDQTIGYYAYKLQTILLHTDPDRYNGALRDLAVLINKPLTKIICPLTETSITYSFEKVGFPLHNFELFFRVWPHLAGLPVVLRNGFLLKAIKMAGIKSFEEIDNYSAVLIFNHAKVNSHICSFVNFIKK